MAEVVLGERVGAAVEEELDELRVRVLDGVEDRRVALLVGPVEVDLDRVGLRDLLEEEARLVDEAVARELVERHLALVVLEAELDDALGVRPLEPLLDLVDVAELAVLEEAHLGRHLELRRALRHPHRRHAEALELVRRRLLPRRAAALLRRLRRLLLRLPRLRLELHLVHRRLHLQRLHDLLVGHVVGRRPLADRVRRQVEAEHRRELLDRQLAVAVLVDLLLPQHVVLRVRQVLLEPHVRDLELLLGDDAVVVDVELLDHHEESVLVDAAGHICAHTAIECWASETKRR